MTCDGGFAIVRTGAGGAWRPHAPRVEKARHGSDLRNDSGAASGRGAHGPRFADGSALSRSGTGARAPLWNGPPLDPAFVAQLLGQALGGASPAAKAQAAYGARCGRPLPLLFDTRA